MAFKQYSRLCSHWLRHLPSLTCSQCLLNTAQKLKCFQELGYLTRSVSNLTRYPIVGHLKLVMIKQLHSIFRTGKCQRCLAKRTWLWWAECFEKRSTEPARASSTGARVLRANLLPNPGTVTQTSPSIRIPKNLLLFHISVENVSIVYNIYMYKIFTYSLLWGLLTWPS